MMAYWFTIEINVPIVIPCIPTIKPLVAKVWQRLLESGPESASISDGPNLSTISSALSRAWGYKIGDN
jgi:hypothetical protein